VLTALGGPRAEPVSRSTSGDVWIDQADGAEDLAAYHRLRHDAFVAEQGLFAGSDLDDVDAQPDVVVLLARTADGEVVGGVRLAPAIAGVDLAWWRGSRLVVSPTARRVSLRIGAALVDAASARAVQEGALRFDATVQAGREAFFTRLGWQVVRTSTLQGAPHVEMRWPIDRIARLAHEKAAIGALFAEARPGGAGWVGDDGAPVPGTDVVTVSDSIVPAMVERDPRWAGWCSVLVNANDLAAMGAAPVGLTDALGVPTTSLGHRVVDGLRAAADAWGVPVLGGHTQLGVHASLSVTMLGRTDRPVPGGGGRPGDEVSVHADLDGGWRPGYHGRQWDSTSARRADELRAQQQLVGRLQPRAAKDVSMAGLVGTLGMLAEASGCGARLRIADVPRPTAAGTADWLTCFPGFAMLVADRPGRAAAAAGRRAPATSAACGQLLAGAGVELEWPDGETIRTVEGPVTGLGEA
jgi:putative N-acetyltransferase (TIGR04045 family)